jgi:immune inhibitor A
LDGNKRNNTLIWWILGAAVILFCCCCLFALFTGGLIVGLGPRSMQIDNAYEVPTIEAPGQDFGDSLDNLAPTDTPSDSADEPQGSSIPTPAPSDFLTEQELKTAVVPARDLRALAEGLRGTGPIPEIVHEKAPVYKVGQTDSFWISNEDDQKHFQIDAELVYTNDVLYVWVEKGVDYDLGAIKKAADKFAKETYPTNRNFFGSEWSPGIDNDPKLHILHSEQLGDSIAGYFSGADEVSSKAQPYSNEREMFYIHIGNAEPNSEFYNGVLSHEFQHMIHWYQDKNESTWVNEGMSELATELNGYSRGGADQVFSELPDTQLTAWSDDPDGRTEHYGAAYLFMSYFLQRFGNEMTQAVVASDANSSESFDEVLQAQNTGLTFDDVFADWVIANYLDDPKLEDGRYGYERDEVQPMALDATYRRFPVQSENDVHQYGTDYVELKGDGDLKVAFRGATTTRLASNSAHSGSYAWWGNREDDSDARLTRSFDLSGVDKATLDFWTWYDIEDNWDYGYVMASTDGGTTWTPLQTSSMTDANPNGNSFGWALTGCSGDPESTEAGDECNAKWIEQSADLTPYAGEKDVLIRFQYITDDAVNYPGFFVDDISIPEIDYSYDAEADNGDWQSEGWLRTDNILQQRWMVQLIEIVNGQDPVITRLPVDENGAGEWTIGDLSRNKEAILAISALAPVTTETAPYEYTISQ